VDVVAVLLDRPLKQTSTGRKGTTRLTLREVESLPIRDGLACIAPQGRLENAKLMVVNGNVHISDGEIFYRLFKFVLIIIWVDPQFPDIARGVAGILQTH
jgi:hypothetical protein